MRINNNIAALRTYTHLLRTNRSLDTSVGRLSSGFRITGVADDAAGYAVSRRLSNQVRGIAMAARNSMDGVSLVATAEGALVEVHAMLQRIRELAVQAANDSNVYEDRERMQAEINQLIEEIHDVAFKTEFNTLRMLSGVADVNEDGDWSFPGLRIQVGANQGMTMTVAIPDIRRVLREVAEVHFGDDASPVFPTPDDTPPGTYSPSGNSWRVSVLGYDNIQTAQAAIQFADDAINALSRVRSHLGAFENRLIHTESNLNNTGVHTQAALSRIKDTDMALEMTLKSQFAILQQAGIAILGQANQRPQQILSLLT